MNEYKYFAYFYDDIFSEVCYRDWYDFVLPYLKDTSTILDLACGSGTLAILLKLKGYEVEGLDLSTSILELARKKAKMHHVAIPFYTADMTNFSLNKTYDVITCFFDSVNFLKTEKEIKDLFSCVYQHLSTNGLFIMDCFSKQMMKDYRHNKKKFRTKTHALLWKTKQIDSSTLKHTIRMKEGKETYIESYFEYYHDIKAFQPDGFEVIKICGDFEDTLQPKDSRILMILKKL